ncbi:tRNA pseudouridine(38-40) synthase TruA [Rhodohalobacter mucosus]|uniref:tRNA pseudouridine synthase A n=1 Tax=Rhodohalobacter mucosus TaxID=2079485 RepID=A0A316TXS2_9BACT|nr:tRNA pseudouridine(38-40) synthase TruA [Rhodohalobacter mucosus]PWN07474.1 tRNA pseudouridine(38-40) synthase TruA [Rhodohalobacter mucosus]
MPRYKLTFEYDGTGFSGWQVQPEARTVEGVAEEAFSTLYQQPVDLIGQGRTDAGVHAMAQTAHADLPDVYTAKRILHAMKGLLPDDVALLQIEKSDPQFHARFNARSRRYRYDVHTRPSPLNRHRYWIVNGDIDESILTVCAGKIIGKQDFKNFCIPPDTEKMTTECTILFSEWKSFPSGFGFTYHIEGNRFLRHMVRRLVGGMVHTAQGKMSIDDFESLLNGPEQKQKAFSAPAHGLTLMEVKY